jgi:hydrogenase maturation protein HypF
MAASVLVRTRARVQGTVQGVGFRPFVYRLAREQGLAGWVLNDDRGVLLEVEGAAASVDEFLARLRAEPPPLAVIDDVACDARAPEHAREFTIRASPRGGGASAPPVTPDSATCPHCLDELCDPGDRRHRYPFINCTDCGPRFTIVTGVPYDRPLTTMAPFTMCEDCAREYRDPADRRFHAQPNACPRCGPRLRVADANGLPVRDLGEALDAADWIARRIAAGAIAAVKSLGGFHLVCDAADEQAVARLRGRKRREEKPFALMCPDVGAAAALTRLTVADIALLTGPARPILLAVRSGSGRVAAAVAPGLPELGVMLPYTPLHHVLLSDFARACGEPQRPLVVTSGNVSDDPIAYRDEDAIERLAPIADLFLLHDREIRTRADDSVVRTVSRCDPPRRVPLVLRRSRGLVPAPLALPVAPGRSLLACGAEQKSTFCLAGGRGSVRAWVGHHIGDLEQWATLQAYTDGIAHFQALFAVTPELVVHDLHPGYLSTSYALQRTGVDHLGVQHHHAHLAACLAEHGQTGPAVGAIYDGTGLGEDGAVWGGELLCGDLHGFTRDGALRAVAMPGGVAAIRQPWRMAAAWLREAFGEPRPLPRRLRGAVSAERWEAIGSIAAGPEVSPPTTSMGRFLDAVGAMCGLGAEITYEGQAAILLEAAAWEAGATELQGYEVELADADGRLVLDPRGLLRELARDLQHGAEVPFVAACVHAAVAAATATAIERIAHRRGLGDAVLSGGCFQNRMLLEAVSARLATAGMRVLVPERLPPNDGGISFGQAAIAAAGDASV